jgi:hypothetical protein
MEGIEIGCASLDAMKGRSNASGSEPTLNFRADGPNHQSSDDWISTEQFSAIADITVQAARRAMRNAQAGLLWRGQALNVREAFGAGGAAGKSWRVRADSLPINLQARLEVDKPKRFRTAKNQGDRISERFAAIEPIFAAHLLPIERRKLVEAAAVSAGVTTETVNEWLKRIEAAQGDINALGWKRPSNAGQRRVHVSRKFDAAFIAAGYAITDLFQLGDFTDCLTRAAWASRVQRAGWPSVQREVVTALQRRCEVEYVLIRKADVHVSKRRICEHSGVRIVDVRSHDRKAFEDGAPCIVRDNRQLKPMQLVVMDVKQCDTVFEISNGRRVWSKEVSFLDLAVMRKFCFFVFPAKGKKVRQEHVVLAFLAMARDPLWGFPEHLYRDNGTEFKIINLLRECLSQLNDDDPRCIINAKPYSARSKAIEGTFATHDLRIVSQMEGWAGGNRHKSKSPKIGKPTPPYDGSFEDYVTEYQNRLTDQEARPFASGKFKGKSPRELMAEHIEQGWRAVHVDEPTLRSAFAKPVEFTIRQAKIRYKKLTLVHPDLPRAGKITGAVSFDHNELPSVRLSDGRWLLLEEERLYHPLDINGAVESAARRQRDNRRVSELKRLSGSIDLEGNLKYRLAALEVEQPLQPNPPKFARLTDETERRALAVAEGQAIKAEREAQPDLIRAGRLAETLALEARHG